MYMILNKYQNQTKHLHQTHVHIFTKQNFDLHIQYIYIFIADDTITEHLDR